MKKNLINLRTLAVASLLLVAVAFTSCGGAEIKQRVEETSCLQKTTRIVTNVIIKDWNGAYKTIEYQGWVVVKNTQVDSVKKAEYEKAIPYLAAACNCH